MGQGWVMRHSISGGSVDTCVSHAALLPPFPQMHLSGTNWQATGLAIVRIPAESIAHHRVRQVRTMKSMSVGACLLCQIPGIRDRPDASATKLIATARLQHPPAMRCATARTLSSDPGDGGCVRAWLGKGFDGRAASDHGRAA